MARDKRRKKAFHDAMTIAVFGLNAFLTEVESSSQFIVHFLYSER